MSILKKLVYTGIYILYILYIHTHLLSIEKVVAQFLSPVTDCENIILILSVHEDGKNCSTTHVYQCQSGIDFMYQSTCVYIL